MVPLVRPSMPYMKDVEQYLHYSSDVGQWSNFGPLWHAASERLNDMTGRLALPCSNGTDALVLALVASQRPYVAVEAFTFQAAFLAAARYAGASQAVTQVARIDDYDAAETSVIRTVPFGSFRILKPEPEAQLIIDAAGAFAPGAFDDYPLDAVITCSFHATKNFPIGEGGCVFLPPTWTYQAKLVRAAMNFGFDEERRTIELPACGNYKLDEVHCAMLLSQLDRAEFFRGRSYRIKNDSLNLSTAPNCWLPYALGDAQSLVAVGHKDPTTLVSKLAEAGFVARQMYKPYPKPALLTYDQAHTVALPSDCTPAEFGMLQEVLWAC